MVLANLEAGRPVLQLPRRPAELALEAVAILGIVATFGMILLSWPTLPDRIPCHFDFTGKPDAWGDRWMIFLLPALSVVMYALLTGIRRIPYRFNYLWEITEKNAERQYRIAISLILILKTEVVVMFGYVTWAMIRAAEFDHVGLGIAFLPAVIVILFSTIIIHVVTAWRSQ